MTLLQRNCTPTKIELQRRVSGTGACHSVLGGPQGPPSGGGPNSARQWRYRGRRNQCVSSNVIHTISFAVDGIGGSPLNGSFSMAITNFCQVSISESRPISKACQRVTSVFDSIFFACSSEREHRILAASRSAKQALLHRERRVQIL